MKPSPALSSIAVRRVDENVVDDVTDVLAVEEPLEIRLGFPDGSHRAISITMRTPGDDGELAAGFLFTEGLINQSEQIKQIRHCGLKIGKARDTIERAAALNSNTIRVDLNDGIDVDLKDIERHFYTTSSCGVCGKSSIDALKTGAVKLAHIDSPRIDAELIRTLPERLRASQSVFDQTGGLHASALFKTDGEMEIVREDVGRHNALDKVIGARFLAGSMPLSESILLVSGRASFELVQKALMAGIPIMLAVGAPSSLAVELATEFGMTLVGFVRNGSFNVYSGAERVTGFS
ncbi:MAG TPA: formate dehydrogenase accessory sulfurtransferase FdhD [Pyrinomonadaceae bacterium]|nr:formate dehydrogenase accessory sulfurtransferase FdhD [Pyrinomonadaceae bacterium]